MNALDYLLKANLYGLLFVGTYWLLLRRHTFFSLNRAYLLVSVVLSLSLPLVSLPAQTVETIPQLSLPTAVPRGEVWLPETSIAASPVDTVSSNSGLDWESIGLIVYGAITLILLIRLGIRIGRLLRFIYQSSQQPEGDFVLVQPHDPTIATFSFFRFLVLNPADTDNPLILRHELVHIRQWHSADVVGMAVLQAIFWAFPTLWLTDRLLRQVHEFLADKQTHQPNAYARFLVEYSFGLQTNSLTNGFFNPSLLKLRVQMLHQRATARWALSKYVLVLPLVFGLLAMTTAREQITAVATQEADDTITVSGQVSGADGKPLPGAQVIIKGRSTGTATSREGNYMLVDVPKNASMVVSFIGFDPQVIAVKGRRVINIVMARAVVLSEVVVTAYETPYNSSTDLSGKRSREIPTSVDQIPEFPGGVKALGQYLIHNLRYPQRAKQANVSGRVFVQFVITEKGEIRELRILKGIGFGCDEEAVRVVSQMPKWNPGKQNGTPVSVQYNLPIQFSLEKKEDKRTGQVSPTTQPDSTPKSYAIDNSKNRRFGLYGDENTDNMNRYAMPLPDSLRKPNTSIRIRGNVLSGEDPLYIIDGIEAPTGGIGKLTPDRIESVTVLKNSAAAAYGPKAQYGVVIITTKKK